MERKACLEILILSLALTVGGAGSSTAQDSKPTGRKPTGKEPTGKRPTGEKAIAGKGKAKKCILLNVRAKKQGYKVVRVDLLNDKVTDLLSTPQGKRQYFLYQVSPNRKIGAAMVGGKDANQPIGFYDLTTGKPFESQIPKVMAFFRFIDNDQLVYIEKVRGAKAGDVQTRIVLTNIKGTTRNVLYQTDGQFWDDIPLSLTPDKKHVTFFARDKDGNNLGLTMIRVKDGKAQSMPAGLTYHQWSVDGKQLFAFSQEKKALLRYNYDGNGKFTHGKSLRESAMVLKNLGNDTFLGITMDTKAKTKKLVVMDKQAKTLFELTDKFESGEKSRKQLASFDAETKCIYFVERERKQDVTLHRLVEAKIKDRKVVSRRVIHVSEEPMKMPFLVRH